MKFVRMRFTLWLMLAASSLWLSGCRSAPSPTPAGAGQEQAREALPRDTTYQGAAIGKPELPPLFKDIERRTFQFFWDTTNEKNGLTPDRYPSRPFSSIAAAHEDAA